MTAEKEKSILGLIVDGRAVFYYPPGSKIGWTLKRLLCVSLAGFLFWSLVLMAMSRAV